MYLLHLNLAVHFIIGSIVKHKCDCLNHTGNQCNSRRTLHLVRGVLSSVGLLHCQLSELVVWKLWPYITQPPCFLDNNPPFLSVSRESFGVYSRGDANIDNHLSLCNHHHSPYMFHTLPKWSIYSYLIFDLKLTHIVTSCRKAGKNISPDHVSKITLCPLFCFYSSFLNILSSFEKDTLWAF